jgi:hypothetical protein
MLDLVEEGDTISILLQFIYPMSNPEVKTLPMLRPALIAAQKYEIASAIDGLRNALISERFLHTDSLGVYAIACELGLKEEARTGTTNSS